MRRVRSEVLVSVWLAVAAEALAVEADGMTNLNVQVETAGLEYPVVLKFRGFRAPEAMTNLAVRTEAVAPRRTVRTQQAPVRRKRKTEEEMVFGEAEALFRHREYGAAAERLRQVVSAQGGQADAARILLARIAYLTNDLESALRALDGVTARRTEASLWRIRFLAGRTNDAAAVAVWERLKQEEEYDGWFVEAFVAAVEPFVRKGLGPSLVADGEALLADGRVKGPKDRLLYGLGQLYERDPASRDLRRAHAYYGRLLAEHPSSPYAEAAQRRRRHLERRYLELK